MMKQMKEKDVLWRQQKTDPEIVSSLIFKISSFFFLLFLFSISIFFDNCFCFQLFCVQILTPEILMKKKKKRLKIALCIDFYNIILYINIFFYTVILYSPFHKFHFYKKRNYHKQFYIGNEYIHIIRATYLII